MKIKKTVVSDLEKCYAVTELNYHGRHCFLVAAEKHAPCFLFSEDGERLETIWTEPGGVMTMAQVPGSDGQFLSTHRFYSPNDSAEARIVIATPAAKDNWDIRTLCRAPFVHRFGILNRGGVNYLIVCCLKSGHEYKNDWRFPGACYGSVLPEDLSGFSEDHPLQLTPIRTGLLRNHGFSIVRHNGHDAALIGTEEGSFLISPPAKMCGEWEVEPLLSVPTSDSVLLDFDGDGREELGVLSPFHGASLTIWHLDEFGSYVPQWKYERPEAETDMLHATCACEILGRPTWVVGWRKGTRKTIAITWDASAGTYAAELIDENTGCANVIHFVNAAGQDVLAAANREINEVALYTITE